MSIVVVWIHKRVVLLWYQLGRKDICGLQGSSCRASCMDLFPTRDCMLLLLPFVKKYPIRKFSRSILQDLLLNPNLTVLKRLSKLWVSSIFPLWKLFLLVICSYRCWRNKWAFNLWSCSCVSQLCTRFLLWLNCDSLAWNGWKHFYRSEQQLWHVVVCALGSMTSFARQVVNTHWGFFFRSQFRCLAHIVKAIGNCKTKFMIYNSS